MNVSLTPELEKFVADKVASGRYTSASEVVREALRTLEDQERSRSLRQAASRQTEPSVEDLLARIRSLGPWQGPTGDQLTQELYDQEGLPR